ncbi:MAG: hypothetical protein WEE36_07050 [Acidimicrobiia bacterium]
MAGRLVGALLIVALVTVACGDDAGGQAPLTDAEQALADVIVAEMTASPDPSDPFQVEASARCFAEGLVGELGITRLAELGIEAQNVGDPNAAFSLMTDPEVEATADIALRCPAFRDALVTEMTADGISDDSADCLVEELVDSGVFRLLVIAEMKGESTDAIEEDAANSAALIGALIKCLTPEELETVLG